MKALPTRDEIVVLWKKYNSDDSLFKHALAVEAAMEHFALKYSGDPEEWGKIGLIHDLDYGMYPDQHCKMTEKILKQEGWDDHYIRAILSHGYGLCTDIKPETPMEKTLYTVDELTGFVTACVLVRPSKSIMDLEVKSVMKKWKTPSFAAKVDRSIIEKGALMLDIKLEDLINDTIVALKKKADILGVA